MRCGKGSRNDTIYRFCRGRPRSALLTCIRNSIGNILLASTQELDDAMKVSLAVTARAFQSATLHTNRSPLTSFRRRISRAACALASSVGPSTIRCLFGLTMPCASIAGMIVGCRCSAWNLFCRCHKLARSPGCQSVTLGTYIKVEVCPHADGFDALCPVRCSLDIHCIFGCFGIRCVAIDDRE